MTVVSVHLANVPEANLFLLIRSQKNEVLMYGTVAQNTFFTKHTAAKASIWLFVVARPFFQRIGHCWNKNAYKAFPRSRFLPGTETHVEQIRAILCQDLGPWILP
jgi:hypothetical protein